MGLNKKGQTVFISIILAIAFFMISMLLINFFKPEILTARSSDNLDCANTSVISDGNKLMCLYTSLTLPMFIITILSISGGIIASRFLT